MKLRIRGNSIRLRLGRSEVVRLATEGILEEFTEFGSGSQPFRYTLQATFDEDAVSATFVDGRIIVTVPADVIQQWARTDVVGIDAVQDISDGEELRILIEKDFECLHGDDGVGEMDADAFPNPQLSFPAN